MDSLYWDTFGPIIDDDEAPDTPKPNRLCPRCRILGRLCKKCREKALAGDRAKSSLEIALSRQPRNPRYDGPVEHLHLADPLPSDTAPSSGTTPPSSRDISSDTAHPSGTPRHEQLSIDTGSRSKRGCHSSCCHRQCCRDWDWQSCEKKTRGTRSSSACETRATRSCHGSSKRRGETKANPNPGPELEMFFSDPPQSQTKNNHQYAKEVWSCLAGKGQLHLLHRRRPPMSCKRLNILLHDPSAPGGPGKVFLEIDMPGIRLLESMFSRARRGFEIGRAAVGFIVWGERHSHNSLDELD